MKTEDNKETSTLMTRDTITRREFLAGTAAVGATILLSGDVFAATDGKKTFTILHTNDMHSNFIGMSPAADYTPFTPNDDATRGGYARLAALITKRKEARAPQRSGRSRWADWDIRVGQDSGEINRAVLPCRSSGKRFIFGGLSPGPISSRGKNR